MKVLVIGSGGREHAIIWKLSQSQKVKEIFCAPGNAGTSMMATNIDISVDDFNSLADFALGEKIDLTIVGPEGPLVAGIVDFFEKKGLRIFGPSKDAAFIEGSKVFAKELMNSAGVPTAKFVSISIGEDWKEKIGDFEKAAVKTDGLAAGKGVFICNSKEEIESSLELIFSEKKFGSAGDRVVVEELLKGEEASILAFCDGSNVKMMVSSQDHKRALDNDEGLNTGGMGAYSPAPVVEGMEERIKNGVMLPVINEMKKRGIPYKGILYAGLMIEGNEFKVLEFNCRFGDPEAQVILPRLESDLLDVLEACIDGSLEKMDLKWSEKKACCVVLASAGYPGSYDKGKEIVGLDNAEKFDDVLVFHAGTENRGGKIVSDGGRVLGVTGLGNNIVEAIENSYTGASQIDFEGMFFRTDIGKKALK